jgi:ribosomal protein S6E (S10)
MVFKINVSHKGRTYKTETNTEEIIRTKIGDKIDGKVLSEDLEGYELEITGTSDIAGFPGIKGYLGPQLKQALLTREDKGMNITKPKGLRLKKTIRGEEISEKTAQINTKVIKEGKKKFDEICPEKQKENKEEKKEQ